MGKRGEKMLQDKNKTAIFSGKFMPPHIGHVLSILELARLYGKVAVIILDYPDREACSADEARDIFNKLFDLVFPPVARQVIQVEVNDIHFAHISFAEYDALLRNIGCCMNHSIYVSGNPEVLENMKTQGIKARYFARSDDYLYTGTKIRSKLSIYDKMNQVDKVLGIDPNKMRAEEPKPFGIVIRPPEKDERPF